MRKVRSEDNRPAFHDVHPPKYDPALPVYDKETKLNETLLRVRPLRRIFAPKRAWMKHAAWGSFAVLLAVGIGGGMYVYEMHRNLSRSANGKLEDIQNAVGQFNKLADTDITISSEEIGRGSFSSLFSGGFGKNFLPVIKNLGQTYKDFNTLSASSFGILSGVSGLQQLLPELAYGREGEKALSYLRSIREELAKISDSAGRLVTQGSELSGILPIDPGDYLALELNLSRARGFMDALIPWLEGPAERKIAVFLENPSELRPGGGFIGSYAEVTIAMGAIRSVEVRDISYADREFPEKIIPPEPLQVLVKRFRAADANWFVDFGESAKKVLAMLEASEAYKKNGVAFDGAVSLSAKAIEDTLRLTGPLTLSSGKKITAENFLPEIQAEVQAGHDAGSTRAKEILSELSPLLIARLTSLSEAEYEKFFPVLGEWGAERDLRVYFKNETFERFFDSYGLTGRVAEIPAKWNGDYLSVVNANIGGGKSDYAMKQKVHLQGQMGIDGTLTNHLVITRKHEGRNLEWWYRMTNQEYVQVLVPPDANLSYANGGFMKKITPPLDYEKEGFARDPDVERLEDTVWDHLSIPSVVSMNQAGKGVFATWTRTEAGNATELSYDYSRRLTGSPEDGQAFQFIFEKQASARGEYIFEFTAPVGFRFKENGLPVFEYATDDPPGRLILELTLEKI